MALLPRLCELGLRVLVVSMNDGTLFATRALNCGALGYVSKNIAPGEFIIAVQAVAEGKRYIEHHLAEQIAFEANDASNTPAALTQREAEIMQLLAGGHSITEIGSLLGVSYKTVANTTGRLRRKLCVGRTSDLIRVAIELQRLQ
jgi:DNA-binding NarL/FixJ family response regulator